MAFYVLRMYYTYLLYSEKLDKYCIGSTSSLQGQLQRHNTSNKGFTSTGKPWVLKYFEVFGSKQDAIKREFQLKSWKDRTKLVELISSADSEHPG